MVEEERGYAYGEHDGDEEEKQDVKSIRLDVLQVGPEFDEVLQRRGRYVQAVERGVAEKENEVFVVAVADAVVHPRTVVVHLEHAGLTNAAVVRAIGLDALALVAIAHGPAVGAREDGQVFSLSFEHCFGVLFAGGRGHLVHVGLQQEEVFRWPLDGREDGLVVGPGEEDENDVVEHKIKDSLDPVADLKNAQLDGVGVVGPAEKGSDEDDRYPPSQAHAAVETTSRVHLVRL